MTKREAELLEHIIRSMSGDEYQRSVFGWLPGGCNGPLWDWMRQRPTKNKASQTDGCNEREAQAQD